MFFDLRGRKQNTYEAKKVFLTGLSGFLLSGILMTAGCENTEIKEDSAAGKESVTIASLQQKETPEETKEEPAAKEASGNSGNIITETPAPAKVRYKEVEKIINLYLNSGEAARDEINENLETLREKNPEAALQWEEIINLWSAVESSSPNEYNTLNPDILPDGLSETDSLCLVVLGYQLNYDGSMKDELIGRLETAKRSAEKYPNSVILCTGGGTALSNLKATEAGEMKKWLIDHGIDESRVIAEQSSLSTGENAIYSLEILNRDYPEVCDIAIITSDYHMATGELLFGAESILRYQVDGISKYKIVSNAAYMASSDTLSKNFQATSLKELYSDSINH
ncbi:MAG: YdcF family protein [Lachnospiraceae bacterium]|nr:YdcF family protein [Lachnospiraceae bacterium]